VYLSFRSTTISPHQTLIEAASIAIWNRNNIAVALAIGTWVINVVFLILGMSFPFQLLQVVCDYANAFLVIGSVRVSHSFMSVDDLLGPSHLQLVRSCTLYGYRAGPSSIVGLSILVATNLLSYPWQLPTPFYFSPCLLACFAYAITVVVPLV
jgi:hypothetical protein